MTAGHERGALDIYVESIAFSNEHLARLGGLAAEAGLALRCHVEQFNANRSVPVALQHGARSVDHLACLHPDDVAPLAASECAAVLLPGRRVHGGRAHRAGPRARRRRGDLRPGHRRQPRHLADGLDAARDRPRGRRYGWTAREAVLAVTHNAAWVIGLHERLGSLEVGKSADLLLLDAPIEHLPYRLGHNPVLAVFREGELIYVRADTAARFDV